MSILGRFKDIMSSNINALLDKAENPEKMVDQYLRNLNSDLGVFATDHFALMAFRRDSSSPISATSLSCILRI